MAFEKWDLLTQLARLMIEERQSSQYGPEVLTTLVDSFFSGVGTYVHE